MHLPGDAFGKRVVERGKHARARGISEHVEGVILFREKAVDQLRANRSVQTHRGGKDQLVLLRAGRESANLHVEAYAGELRNISSYGKNPRRYTRCNRAIISDRRTGEIGSTPAAKDTRVSVQESAVHVQRCVSANEQRAAVVEVGVEG